MKKTVSLGELLVASIALFLAGIGAYVNIKTTQSTQENRLYQIEQNYKGIQSDLRDIKSSETQILIKLEDKVNRKP